MPTDNMEKSSASPVAATPANMVTTSAISKTASERRKSSKPIVEKRRRARINESLCQLKTLILNALKKDTSRHSKLEKADILEMTVKHLKNLQQLQMTGALNTDPSVLGKYRAGFSECMNEVTRFLSTCEGVNAEIRTQLLSHLASCIAQISVMNCSVQHPVPSCTTHPAFGQPVVQVACASPHLNGVVCKTGTSVSISSEAAKVYSGFQILPATDGKFAFLIPSSAFVPSVPVLPLNGPSTGGGGTLHGSPVAQLVPGDSVWRPW
ncbi:hypothetical protein ACEWY4_007208 [Coilia grayii]|uniref:Uncharacterized protein n=1 Tax=Coilia grayii TaxID=363190 RepID=A0ABD1KG34_9TELE